MRIQDIVSVALLAYTVSATSKPVNFLKSSCNSLTSPYTWKCPAEYANSTDSNTGGRGGHKKRARGGRGKTTGSSQACMCWSSEYLATYADCALREEHGKNGRGEAVIKLLVETCSAVTYRPGLTYKDVMAIYKNATDNFIDSSEATTGVTLRNPLYINDTAIHNYYRTNKASDFSMYSGELYGWAMLGYFAGIMLIATCFNFFKTVFPVYSKTLSNKKPIRLIRQKFANPAFGSFKNGTPFKWGWKGTINMSVPTRVQSWVIIGYLIIFTILMFVEYDLFDENTRFKSKRLQLSQYVSDRSGYISIIQMPLLYLFAARNNFAMLFTGWSFDTMNAYHRWIARVTVIAAFIHSVGYTDIQLLQGGLAKRWAMTFMVWGIVATTCGCLLCFFSLRHFREYTYEFFLWSHWILVAFWTIGTWYHIKRTHADMEWVYATVAVWAFDRAVRLFRIIANGVNASAEVELVDEEFLKTTVSYNNFLWSPRAGQYVFIHWLLPLWRCWENHPFTIYKSVIPGEENKFVVTTRIFDGKTKHLGEYLAKKGGKVKMPVLIDGPYGHAFPIFHCDTIILVSGGIGFTACFSYIQKLTTQAEKKRIVFFWVCKKNDHAAIFKKEIDFMTQLGIDVQVYFTAETASSSASIEEKRSANSGCESSSEDEKRSIDSGCSATVHCGRPDIYAAVENYVSEAPGSIGFFVCGPPALNDSIRDSVSKNMDKGKASVEVFVEGFSW